MTQPELSTSLVQRIAAAVSAHPAVIRLDSGPLHAIASYLPGVRLDGVFLGERGQNTPPDTEEPGCLVVEVGVVLAVGRPVPDVVAELRALVTDLVVTELVDDSSPGASTTTVRIAAVDVTVAEVQ